jgi:hypothetical protein
VGWFIFWILFAFIIGAIIGAQITSHEERALDYNLEDLEMAELARIEKYASAGGKAAIVKLKAGAARAKALEEQIAGDIRRRV